MKKEIKWSIALFAATLIGYLPVISEYTSKKIFLGIPIYVLLLVLQTLAVLSLLFYAGFQKDRLINEGVKND